MSARSRGQWWISDKASSNWHLSSFRMKRCGWCRPTSTWASTNQTDQEERHSFREVCKDYSSEKHRPLFMFKSTAKSTTVWTVLWNLRIRFYSNLKLDTLCGVELLFLIHSVYNFPCSIFFIQIFTVFISFVGLGSIPATYWQDKMFPTQMSATYAQSNCMV